MESEGSTCTLRLHDEAGSADALRLEEVEASGEWGGGSGGAWGGCDGGVVGGVNGGKNGGEYGGEYGDVGAGVDGSGAGLHKHWFKTVHSTLVFTLLKEKNVSVLTHPYGISALLTSRTAPANLLRTTLSHSLTSVMGNSQTPSGAVRYW